MLPLVLNRSRSHFCPTRGRRLAKRFFASAEKGVVGLSGAGGIIGGVLWNALQDAGYQVVGIDRPTPSSQGAPGLSTSAIEEGGKKRVHRECNFADEANCKNIFEGCTHVIHLAASGSADALMREEILPNNIIGMINACEEARSTPTVKRFIFASTNHTMHGDTMGSNGPGSMDLSRLQAAGGAHSFSVQRPFAPDSSYAVSKAFGEVYGNYLSRVESAFEFIALRIGWCAYDDPNELDGTIHEDYLHAMWLSKKDAVGFFLAALDCEIPESQDGFLSVYAVSNNQTCPFDVMESSKLIGYSPVDGFQPVASA